MAQGDEDKSTIRLDMDELYRQAVELVGQAEADRLWSENRLDSEDKWPGQWAKAMEIVEELRSAASQS